MNPSDVPDPKTPTNPEGAAPKPKRQALGPGGVPVGAVMVFSLGPSPGESKPPRHWLPPSPN